MRVNFTVVVDVSGASVVACDEDFDVGCVADFLQELAAVAAGSVGDGEALKGGFGIEGEIGDEELFGVDRVVERETRELEIGSEEYAAGGSETDGANVEFGYRRTSQGLGRFDQGRKELVDRQA